MKGGQPWVTGATCPDLRATMLCHSEGSALWDTFLGMGAGDPREPGISRKRQGHLVLCCVAVRF